MFSITRLFKRNVEFIPGNTPDYESLQDAPGWPFFEYGELKAHMPYHDHILHNLSPRRIAYTSNKYNLWMWNDNHYAFPIATSILPQSHPVRRGRIQGEIYVIPTHRIPHLDNFRMNGVQFNRKEIAVDLPDRETIKAFAYIGAKDYWQDKFDWAETFFRGRENSALSLIEPHTDKRYQFGWYSVFTKDHLKERPTRCFIGLTNGDKPQQ